MANLLSRLFGSRTTSRGAVSRWPARPVGINLGLEALEDRVTPSVTFSNGVIDIRGTNGNDTAIVVNSGSNLVVTDNGVKTTFAAFKVTNIYFNGYDGNDSFTNNTAKKCSAQGDSGNDTLIGGSANDGLNGGDGEDELRGNGGNDQLMAGYLGHDDGHNIMDGGVGNDTLLGSDGNDDLFGGIGHDVMYGYAGEDFMDGGADNDTMYGGSGSDTLQGGAGDDYLDGGDDGSRDFLNGGAGRDRFQVESYRANPYTYFYSNRDKPEDFTSGEDSYFGSDEPGTAQS